MSTIIIKKPKLSFHVCYYLYYCKCRLSIIITDIKITRLECKVLVNRMNSNKIIKISSDNRPDFIISKGRPRLGWIDNTQKYFIHCGISKRN